MLPEYEMLMPETLPEALGALQAHAPDVAPVAGGTNLIADMRCRRHSPAVVVDVARLESLRGIREEDGVLVLGAGTTLTEVLRSPLVAEHAPVLTQAAALFANPLIRNRATVGGNLADASPAADTAPPLLVLDAEVELQSAEGTRRIPLETFFVHVRRTVRRPDELLTALHFPVPGARSGMAFHKVGLRKADAISVLSVAVRVDLDGEGRCEAARIALGAVAPRPLRVPEAEALLQGERPSEALIAEAAQLAMRACSPIDDLRGPADYRRRVVGALVRRLLVLAVEQAGKE